MSEKSQESLEYVSTIQENSVSKSDKPWIKRTFGKMEDGGIRGNIFLMTISTVGSTFFYLPYYAKQVGIATIILLLAIPACLSYYSSYKLYHGFKHTKAKTYDECMRSILGPKLGYLSNVAIFMHTFSSVVGAWVFSFKVLMNFISCVSKWTTEELNSFPVKTVYFLIIMTVLFISSISGKVDKLKVVSMFGIGIVLYMAIVFGFQTSQYNSYYKANDSIDIINFNIKGDIFEVFYKLSEAYGLCFFMYLNQYTIIPICNNIKQVTSKRISKVIGRTTVFVFLLFLTVTFIGYFSWPNYETSHNFDKLFVLREPINLKKDYLITIGKLFFAMYLLIGMLVKGHFFLIYFNQLLANTMNIIKGDKVKLLDADHIDEQTAEEKKARMTKSKQQIRDISQSQTHVEIHIDPVEENGAEEQSTNEAVEEEKSGMKKHIINFIFLLFTAVLTIIVADGLSSFLSIAGGYVAVLEVIVFPLLMILAIDNKKQILSKLERPLLIVFSMLFIIFGLTASTITLAKKIAAI